MSGNPADAEPHSGALSRTGDSLPGRKWYTLGVLVVAYVLAFVDRQILSLLVEPLKRDLLLSDTQISLLQGPAFAVCLAAVGLPLGRLVDRSRRVTIIAAGIAIWSAMTAGCGLASGFLALMMCRIGVGAGEAALTPAAHSIVSDIFPPRRLGLALGIFGIGSYVGAGLALLGGAVALAHLPQTDAWRIVFLCTGALGLPVALWLASLREPPRLVDRRADRSLRDAIDYFRIHGGAMVRVNLTAAFVAMAVYASGAWIPSFLIRSYALTAATAGTAYGLIVISCGIAGTIGGGALSDYAIARGIASGRLLVMALASLTAAPFAVGVALASQASWSIALLVPFTLLTTISLGVLPATQQAIAPSNVRGLTAALGIVMVNMLGLGLGPTAIAVFTDHVLGDPLLIRKSLALLLPVMLCAATVCGCTSLGRYAKSVQILGNLTPDLHADDGERGIARIEARPSDCATSAAARG